MQCVVALMLFMALAESWKSIVVSGVSMQTLFIIIIIIIINHPSSGVPGPSNALNHRPGRTQYYICNGKDGRREGTEGINERDRETWREVGGKKIHPEEL